MTMKTIQMKRKAFAESRVVEDAIPEIAEGQILVRVDKFALTANNVTYALSGDAIGYWKFYPAEEPWGVVPVWGFADVVGSRCPEIPVGERLWGFLPMATHAVLTPSRVTPRGFMDCSPHREGLAGAYNAYARASGDSAELKSLEDERCILFPLYTTSFVLYDYLADNAFFGADQIVISSASSKTSLGLQKLLKDHPGERPDVIGLTSPRNLDFVTKLGVCDRVVAYDNIAKLDATRPTAFVDMAGQGSVTRAVHDHFGAALKLSCAVGVTHWETDRFSNKHAPLTPHTFFFAPSQIAKRDKDWGPGEARRRAQVACLSLVADLKGAMRVAHENGPEAAQAAFLRLVEGRQPPDVAIMTSLTR